MSRHFLLCHDIDKSKWQYSFVKHSNLCRYIKNSRGKEECRDKIKLCCDRKRQIKETSISENDKIKAENT